MGADRAPAPRPTRFDDQRDVRGQRRPVEDRRQVHVGVDGLCRRSGRRFAGLDLPSGLVGGAVGEHVPDLQAGALVIGSNRRPRWAVEIVQSPSTGCRRVDPSGEEAEVRAVQFAEHHRTTSANCDDPRPRRRRRRTCRGWRPSCGCSNPRRTSCLASSARRGRSRPGASDAVNSCRAENSNLVGVPPPPGRLTGMPPTLPTIRFPGSIHWALLMLSVVSRLGESESGGSMV